MKQGKTKLNLQQHGDDEEAAFQSPNTGTRECQRMVISVKPKDKAAAQSQQYSQLCKLTQLQGAAAEGTWAVVICYLRRVNFS